MMSEANNEERSSEGKPLHLTTNYQFAIIIALTFLGTLATQVNLLTASLMLGIAIVMTVRLARKLNK